MDFLEALSYRILELKTMYMAWNKKHGEMIRQYLLRYRQTIAVAESVTAGWMQVALSSLPDAAQFFQGGITTYNLGQKSRHLAIEPIQAAACNCVSQEVADQMALGVENLFTSHWGIGICGYASPVPESGKKLFAFYSVAWEDKLMLRNELKPPQLAPAQVQQWYTKEIIAAWVKLLGERI